jgi:hypothetical protein
LAGGCRRIAGDDNNGRGTALRTCATSIARSTSLSLLAIGEASVAAGEVLQPEDEELMRRAGEFVAWVRQGLKAGEYEGRLA